MVDYLRRTGSPDPLKGFGFLRFGFDLTGARHTIYV